MWVCLDNYFKDVQEYMIYLVLNKFMVFFNGEGNIFGNNKVDLLLIICVWKLGLCDVFVKCILNGLYRVLVGNMEYQKWFFFFLMVFYFVCKYV